MSLSRRRLALLGALSVFASLSVARALDEGAMVTSHYQAVSQDPTIVFLQAGEIDPTTSRFSFAPELVAASEATPKRATSRKSYFLVQFDSEPTVARLDSLRSEGWEFLDYVPNNAWIVRVDAGAKSLASVSATEGVRWADAYRAGHKVSAEAVNWTRGADKSAGVVLLVNLWLGEDRKSFAGWLQENLGAEILGAPEYVERPALFVRIDPARLGELAAMDEVRFVERPPSVTFRNDIETQVSQTGSTTGGRPVWAQGLRGENQVVGHIDGEIAMGSCYVRDAVNNTPGPTHRKVVRYRGTQGSDVHGTHTIATAVGLNVSGSLTEAGHAYNAKISHATDAQVTGWGSTASNLEALFLEAQTTTNAFVHTNSWGEDGVTNYTSFCVDIDRYMWTNEDALVVFAATNQSVLYTPENAKNVLAVGAAGSNTNFNSIASGGTGPTADGRRKPEIFAQGQSTVSASTGTCNTTSLTGTSMATPNIAGNALLVRQYFTEGFHPTGAAVPGNAFTPSGALIKATLLNSTVDMTSVAGYPGAREGWGRLVLNNSLFFSGDTRRLFLADERRSGGRGLAQGSSRSYNLNVTSTTEPLKVTLVYNDAPVALNTTLTPVNNLNLRVVGPGGTTYLGNVFSGGVSTTGGSADNLNNVEMVLVNAPTVGAWTLTVEAATVNAGFSPQGYAIVASGALAAGARGTVSFDRPVYGCGGTVTASVIDGNLTGASTTMTVTTPAGDSETVTLNETAPGSSSYSGTFTVGSGTPTVGNSIVEGASGTQFTGTYADADTGSGPENISTSATIDCTGAALSGVGISNITDTAARVAFTANETVTGTVVISTTPGGAAVASAPFALTGGSAYAANVTGLAQNTSYFARVQATDAAGNATTENNGGAGYAFTTMQRITQFSADFQPDGDGFTIATTTPTGGSGDWRWVTGQSFVSASGSMFVPNLGVVQDATMVSPSIALSATPGQLTFWHTYEFEASGATIYDGGVLEVRIGAGAWADVGATNITTGTYSTSTIPTGWSNPLAGRRAWGGGTIGPMTQVVVDLTPWAGQTVQFRWRFGADNTTTDVGWYVDDVMISRLAPGGSEVRDWQMH